MRCDYNLNGKKTNHECTSKVLVNVQVTSRSCTPGDLVMLGFMCAFQDANFPVL